MVEVGDINIFADKVISITKNEEMWNVFSKNAKENADNYSEGRIIKLWMELFDKV